MFAPTESLAFQIDGPRAFELSRRRARRGTWLLGLGGFGLLFGTFWMLWGVIVVLTGVGIGNGIIVFFFGGVGPALGAAIVSWAGARRRRDAEALVELALLSEGRPDIGLEEAADFLGRDAREVAGLMRLAGQGGAATPVQSSGFRPARPSVVDTAALLVFRRARLRRTLLLALAAMGVLGFATLWVVVGVAGIATGEWVVGLLLLIPGGAFPLLGSLALGWRALTNWRRAARAARLAAAFASGTLTHLEDLAQRMRVSEGDTRATALEALELGLVPREALAKILEPSRGAPARSPAPLPLDAWVGRALDGGLRVEGLLAHGGMGAVFRARNLTTGQSYAVKVLLPDMVASPDALRRFELEAVAASRLGHPGIVRVHDFARSEDGAAYLVMDLLEGETLEARLQRLGTLPWVEARRIVLEVGDALACAHEAGLLHRDIKPANVFLSRTREGERAVLLDFGLAKPLGESAKSRMTTSGLVAGTPLYMSPEQARGEHLDVRSDVYGLAVVAYEMIAGVPPFFDKTVAEVYARLLRETAPRLGQVAPGSCPAALDAILTRALSPAPAERPASVRELLAELASVPQPSAAAG
ncbi:MAG: serine/threonine protein kinase [Polyangiaceae bacterium]|nr:serine/threonine protein kinase [Polyangiaceae bacterium]MCL4753932.1 serine/threonine protein kinase [Myxococcales bacterium]